MHQLSEILAWEHLTKQRMKALWKLGGSSSPFSRNAAGLAGSSGTCGSPAGSHPRRASSLKTLLATLSLLPMKSSSSVWGRAKPAVCFDDEELINQFSSAKPGSVMGYSRANTQQRSSLFTWGAAFLSTGRELGLKKHLQSLCSSFSQASWCQMAGIWKGSPTLLCAVLVPAPLRSKLTWDHLKKVWRKQEIISL